MSNNATTQYYRNLMDAWPEIRLVEALRNGLPWHEHVAARELLKARKAGRLRRRQNLAWRARAWRNLRGAAHLSWLCLLPIVAAVSSTRIWRSMAAHQILRRP